MPSECMRRNDFGVDKQAVRVGACGGESRQRSCGSREPVGASRIGLVLGDTVRNRLDLAGSSEVTRGGSYGNLNGPQ
jgi:hypothetical protein